jgi:two-component system C4-dicarboxylate transport response regulator DctD
MSDSILPFTDRRLEGASLLLVEDDSSVRRALRRALELDGALLVEAENGEEAIRILEMDERQLLDLVLTDLEMPVVSGHELIAVLEECRPDLPIVAMTGYSRPVAFGPAVPLFRKPVDTDELVLTLAPLVRQSKEMRLRARQMRADAAESRSLAHRQLGIARQQHAQAVDLMGTLERQRAQRGGQT